MVPVKFVLKTIGCLDLILDLCGGIGGSFDKLKEGLVSLKVVK